MYCISTQLHRGGKRKNPRPWTCFKCTGRDTLPNDQEIRYTMFWWGYFSSVTFWRRKALKVDVLTPQHFNKSKNFVFEKILTRLKLNDTCYLKRYFSISAN